MYGLLRRALRSASKEDLEQVVLHCVSFTDGLRAQGFITEELARQAHDYLTPGTIVDAIADDSSTDRTALSGPGAVDWTDEEWQEHVSQAPHIDVPADDDGGTEEGLGGSTDIGSGHQTSMERDDDTDRQERAEALPEDGAG